MAENREMTPVQDVLYLPTTNGKKIYPTGCSDSVGYWADLAAKRKAAQREFVEKKYGKNALGYTFDIIRAENELNACVNCTGLPCCKRDSLGVKGSVPKIIINKVEPYVEIRYYTCALEKQRRFQAKIEKLKGLSRIPEEYIGKTFADYVVDDNNADAVKVAKALLKEPKQGAYFCGKAGAGKTLLAAITAQEIIKRGRQVIFATVPVISRQIRSTFRDKSKVTESEIIDLLENAETLILDDMGMEKPTRFICSTICTLINERYNARRQTIITSNYTLRELEYIFNHPTDDDETYDGTRIFDRCKQMCFPVELKGESRR